MRELTVIMQWVITPIIKNEAISAAKLQAKVIGESFAKDLGKSAALTKAYLLLLKHFPLIKINLLKIWHS